MVSILKAYTAGEVIHSFTQLAVYSLRKKCTKLCLLEWYTQGYALCIISMSLLPTKVKVL